MVAGILTVAMLVPGSQSLKDKRQVVKSVLANVRNKFNVSAAEVGGLDSHRRAQLAFACVSNDAAFVSSVLNKVLRQLESNPLCEVEDSGVEMI